MCEYVPEMSAAVSLSQIGLKIQIFEDSRQTEQTAPHTAPCVGFHAKMQRVRPARTVRLLAAVRFPRLAALRAGANAHLFTLHRKSVRLLLFKVTYQCIETAGTVALSVTNLYYSVRLYIINKHVYKIRRFGMGFCCGYYIE